MVRGIIVALGKATILAALFPACWPAGAMARQAGAAHQAAESRQAPIAQLAPAGRPAMPVAVGERAASDATTGGSALSGLSSDDRWYASLAAFAAADKTHPPTPGGVLFVGSSSIRLWNGLESLFRSLPVVVKRGFGGSRMLDCARHLHRLVLPYRPRMVVVYAGDNDLAEGRTPVQVLQAFSAFVDGVRQSLPDTRIAYISIKPSPARESLIPLIRQANDMIHAYTLNTRNTDFIDVYTPMLDPQGRPRAELFREDSLHLNASGYALWKQIISSHLN